MSVAKHLIVFTRYPRPGVTKTRLIPSLGRRGAARLHRELAGHTVLTARRAACEQDIRLEVCGAGATPPRFRSWLGRGIDYTLQHGGDPGERMRRAFARALDNAERVIIIGTDCPGITPALIGEAFARLATHDLVLGPAGGGGYYLVGLRQPIAELFRDMPWGESGVLERTLQTAQRLKLNFARLPVLDDVDRADDLPTWEQVAPWLPRRGSATSISVVIPALNEAERIGPAIESARGEAHEVIVVDGGSADGTRDIAYSQGARVLAAPRNRACQMNAGALAAEGNVLLFLHADTRLPRNFAASIRRLLTRHTAAGAFRLRLDGSGRALRVVEAGTWWRSRWGQTPYGDQGLFLKARIFRATGGFAALPIMEDLELVRRLRRRGAIRTSRTPVIASARRWEVLGTFRTTWINQLMVLGYDLGVSPERLAAFYNKQPRQ